jgi:hypothetical protein
MSPIRRLHMIGSGIAADRLGFGGDRLGDRLAPDLVFDDGALSR